MKERVYIVTGENQTGSKHYYRLSDALRYIKKLMGVGFDVSITIKGGTND